jgi:hypothetical protein
VNKKKGKRILPKNLIPRKKAHQSQLRARKRKSIQDLVIKILPSVSLLFNMKKSNQSKLFALQQAASSPT